MEGWREEASERKRVKGGGGEGGEQIKTEHTLTETERRGRE
jgi:hypothetical protein